MKSMFAYKNCLITQVSLILRQYKLIIQHAPPLQI